MRMHFTLYVQPLGIANTKDLSLYYSWIFVTHEGSWFFTNIIIIAKEELNQLENEPNK